MGSLSHLNDLFEVGNFRRINDSGKTTKILSKKEKSRDADL